MSAPTYSPVIEFGAGSLFFNPVGGNIPTHDTPQEIAELQDVAIDISATIKELRSQNQWPDDTAISDRKCTFKSGSGTFDIAAMNNLFYGESGIQTGGTPLSVNEQHTIAASSPYVVDVTQAADFVTDLGVSYLSNGQKLTRVTGTPASGQYSVSMGVYLFAAADASLAVSISYTYTVVTGNLLTVTTHPQGFGPSLELFLSNPYREYTPGIPNYLHLYGVKISKWGLPYKRADYMISDIEGEAFANAAGNVFDFYIG